MFSCYVCHTCGCHRTAYCSFFSVVGSGDSIQIIRHLWQELLPAEPSNCPRILLSGHINTTCVSTQICKSVIYWLEGILYLLLNVLLRVPVCRCVCTPMNKHTCMCIWRAEEELAGSLLSFHHVGPGDKTQVIRLSRRYLHPWTITLMCR